MKSVQLILGSVLCALAILPGHNAFAAPSGKSGQQSALQRGTSVRKKTQAAGLYNQACYDAYYGCMDQFCISEIEESGSCQCSDMRIGYDKQLGDIKKTLADADNILTIEIEKVRAGANADIVFTGKRRYDQDGNLLALGELTAEEQRQQELERWISGGNDDDVFDEDDDGCANSDDITCLRGNALFEAAEELCLPQIPDDCDGDLPLLQKMYATQIVSDCKGFENNIAQQKADADLALVNANADLNKARQETLADSNKYKLDQCMLEFTKCMQTTDACGENWENCVATAADNRMQNISILGHEDVTVGSVKYDITESTMTVLNNKRHLCEGVMSQCVAVRDQVWPAFLRNVVPSLKVAEKRAESKMRQACLADISQCIHTACVDNIAGKGKDSMDACLARPEMVRSFCKVELEPCERMEPLIWGYVKDKLAAMRIDVCTQEVKDCFTADTRCGANFQNCIGLDYESVRDMCPVDSLVVCKAGNPNFSIEDLDSMLSGLYMNIDNSLLDRCQELVDQKMLKICGSVSDCNLYAVNESSGTNSLRLQQNGDVYRVTGMISFGAVKVGDAAGLTRDGKKRLEVGQIGVQDYMEFVRKHNKDVPGAEAILVAIEEELNNIARTINRAIDMIEQDVEIQYCVSGRDIGHIADWEPGQKPAGGFPNLLNQVKMQIANAALKQAQENYSAKFNEMVTNAARDASDDVAQYMCQMLPDNNAVINAGADASTALSEAFAISYDVASGFNKSKLTNGGNRKIKISSNGGSRDMWTVFDRESRICRVCTETVTKSCEITAKGGLLGLGAKNVETCTESEPVQKCEDIQM